MKRDIFFNSERKTSRMVGFLKFSGTNMKYLDGLALFVLLLTGLEMKRGTTFNKSEQSVFKRHRVRGYGPK